MQEHRPLPVSIAQRGISGKGEALCLMNAVLMSQYFTPAVRAFTLSFRASGLLHYAGVTLLYNAWKNACPWLARIAQRGIWQGVEKQPLTRNDSTILFYFAIAYAAYEILEKTKIRNQNTRSFIGNLSAMPRAVSDLASML